MINCIFENGNKASLRHVTIDVSVIQGNKVLLVKRAKGLLEAGKWSLIGGFVDRDETIQQAVAREIFEETGWRVKEITFLRVKDSSNRPHEDRQNICFAFFCTAEKKEGEKDWESDEVKWFDLNNLPTDIAFDHGDDIELYKKYLKQEFILPMPLQ